MPSPQPWSDHERAVLGALADTFVDGGGARRAEAAAAVLDLVVDPAQIRQLRLVLRAMDTRLVNLALAGRPTPFRSMSPEARERYLLGWAGSRLAQRRSAFGAFRKLLTFLAYADPDAPPDDPRLAAIGYRPDDPPIPAALAPIRPFDVPRPSSPEGIVTLDADAVVVGSGAGGGVVAAALAAAGRSVVVVEAGPFVDEATMPRREVDAFERLYLDRGLLTTWDGSITMLAGSAVGGGTLINWMTSIAAPASVRAEWASDHGLEGVIGEAWEGDVRAIEADLDVAESTHVPPKDGVILRGAQALGWEAGPTRRNASECGDCGSCGFGCRRGTKRSGIRTHLAAAAAAGARIVPEATVSRVLVDGGHAVGVEAAVARPDGGPPWRLQVRARTVVLAAGALRTPAILQRSGLDHPAIGRHLRVHPVPVVAGRFSEPIELWRGTLQAARSLEFVEPAPGRRGYVIESAPGHPGLLAQALPWEGRAAHAALMADAAHLSPLIAVTRDGGEGRLTLTKAGFVRIDYRLDASGVATMRHALASMARLARAAGAESILAASAPATWYHAPPGGRAAGDEDRSAGFHRFIATLETADFRPNRSAVFSAHQLGSVRMGADPATHPCDPWGRVRNGASGASVVDGLYVGDGSVCPTALGVNPMITIMALARRLSRVVLGET